MSAVRYVLALAALGAAAFGAAVPAAQAAGACLSMPLGFETGPLEGCPSAARLDDAMEAPLAVGPRDPATGKAAGLEMRLPAGGASRRVKTCAAYLEARAAGATAPDGQAEAESYLRVACATLVAMRASSAAATSRFEAEGVGLATLALLPPAMLPAASSEIGTALDQVAAQGLSVADMAAVGDVIARTGGSGQVDLAYGDIAASYREVARGDFDGDGSGDLLVFGQYESMSGADRRFDLFALAYEDGATLFRRFAPPGMEGAGPAP